jgi:hypothetical protein
MSESGAFEVSYNVFAEPRAPMFFAVWKHAPIKTTLLRGLEDVCDVTYREFEDPEDLRGDLQHFFRRIAKTAASAPISPATRQTWRTEPERTDLNLPRRHDLGPSRQSVEQLLAPGRVDAQS